MVGPLVAMLAVMPPVDCAPCHSRIAASYAKTGMGRSLSQPGAIPEAAYYHAASGRHYRLIRRDGRYFMRRHQMAPDGREMNVVEREIHYVLGSGNHARTFLHRTPQGRLVDLPLAWYAEGEGSWAMAPGYDRPDHMDFRREIGDDCIFCHNGYPQEGRLSEGIDCQRCHGPGAAHVRAAKSGASSQQIRGAIVNPARLSAERQLEVCLQCHLESTTRRLPYAIRRFGRGAFSYQPGQSLGDYALHFDHAPGSGYDDKFEVAHAGYQFLKSACFRKSNGAMTCTTCHNPHDVPRGDAAVRHYTSVCRGCHGALPAAHTAAPQCLDCHMPKRRTDDAVHVIMTDHRIRRHPPDRDLLQPRPETPDREDASFVSEVVLLYPAKLAPEDELYLALAQVRESANLKAGIPRLERAIVRFRPAQAEFYFELAEAYKNAGQSGKAASLYREALRRNPAFAAALRQLGAVLAAAGKPEAAAPLLEEAATRAPTDYAIPNLLGTVYQQLGRFEQAAGQFRLALSLNADLPEAHNNRAVVLARLRRPAEAEAASREAIRARPDFAAAHNNLAAILDARGDIRQARWHYEKAIHLQPAYSQAHYNLGVLLMRMGRRAEALEQLRQAAEGSDAGVRAAAIKAIEALRGRGAP